MKYIKIFEYANPTMDFIIDFGFFISLNTAHLSQYMTDKNVSNEIQQQFRAKVINGMTYSEMVNSDLIKNPKVTPHILKYIKDLINYVEPRFNKYLTDDGKKKYLPRIVAFKSKLKDIY